MESEPESLIYGIFTALTDLLTALAIGNYSKLARRPSCQAGERAEGTVTEAATGQPANRGRGGQAVCGGAALAISAR